MRVQDHVLRFFVRVLNSGCFSLPPHDINCISAGTNMKVINELLTINDAQNRFALEGRQQCISVPAIRSLERAFLAS